MYLAQFTAGGRLEVYDRVTGKLRRDTPKNVGAITDYYVLTKASGERDESVEHGYLSSVESMAAPILKQLAECHSITDEQHDVFATFVAFMCTRVPAFETTYAQLRQEASSEPVSVAEMHRGRIEVMIELAAPLIAAFKAMDWWLLRAAGEQCFVTSDAPMGLIRLADAPALYGEISPNVLRFFALSPHACLLLADRRADTPCLLVKRLDDEGVAEVNAAIARAAVRLVISHNRDQLEAVLVENALRNSTFVPGSVIVGWHDPTEGRFGLSIRLHHDTTFPLEVPLKWECRACRTLADYAMYVGADYAALHPEAYTEWLNHRCATCGRTPRETESQLGEDIVDLSPTSQ
jgi:hypothetical protein